MPEGCAAPPPSRYEVRWGARGRTSPPFLGAVPGAVEAPRPRRRRGGRPLALELKGAGGFPSARRPRVVWAGVGGEVEALAGLAAELGRRLAPLGFPPEDRPLSPHLTLGRAREGRGAPGLGGALARWPRWRGPVACHRGAHRSTCPLPAPPPAADRFHSARRTLR
jgi:2'-5' RNA ligase